MSWQKYSICKKCGYFEQREFDHAKVFHQICPRCGESSWECGIVAKEIFVGKWYNPFSWNSKLIRKQKETTYEH